MTILQGLTTMVLTADDVDAASRWYADLLGITPYYRSPQAGPCAYTEFRIGPDEDELGIMDRSFMTPSPTPTASPITYWHTDDIHTTFTTLVAHGAYSHVPITERGADSQQRLSLILSGTRSASCTVLTGGRATKDWHRNTSAAPRHVAVRCPHGSAHHSRYLVRRRRRRSGPVLRRRLP